MFCGDAATSPSGRPDRASAVLEVLEAAVVGVPHPTLGEEVAALVVVRPGEVPDPEALRAYARERVAAYKYPRLVVLVESLPKGPTGKILKREIDVGLLLGEAE